ncbi:arrestin-C isoform X4 [Mus musculus]|uniref:arrestin-C isoform X4 n=1 Tax=Mus musculus TaxID=10090 RepID=UPI0003D759AE|nr:arrestin-C isoform X4 [Mus musculus]|eukprot:XP_006527927.1 PREDICTED: arrestin-C isoform X4 [Mus musculus]
MRASSLPSGKIQLASMSTNFSCSPNIPSFSGFLFVLLTILLYDCSPHRVFKKTSSNGKFSIYLGKRDFVDDVDTVEPIDGVVLVDPEYLEGRKSVFVRLTCAFRYGRDDLDVIGLTFRKDLYVQTKQVAPAEPTSIQGPLTALQERLLHKLGVNAYPFTLQMVANLPCSVTLQPGPEDSGKPCGVDFEVKSFCAENLEEKIPKSDSVQLVVRKVQFSALEPGPGPSAQTIRSFFLSSQPLQLQAWMDREVHYHGEAISVHVSINNYTNKVIRRIKIAGLSKYVVSSYHTRSYQRAVSWSHVGDQLIGHLLSLTFSVVQTTDVVLYSLDKYTKTVFVQEFTETVAANSSFSQTFAVTPLLAANCQKQGLALDGKLKHEDTNLASSTIILGGLPASDVGVELPVILIHPKPSPGERAGEATRNYYPASCGAKRFSEQSGLRRSDNRQMGCLDFQGTQRRGRPGGEEEE